MPDIFLSYSSGDRERVEPLYAALSQRGFDVFWDQKVPIATDWDTWIRERLADARVALIVWSHHSVQSRNVRHEAVIAQEQGKLVSVLLDSIPAAQFPMGLYAVEAADLSSWSGEVEREEFRKLSQFLEDKLTPPWLRGVLDAKDQVLADERAGRAAMEGHLRTLRQQIARDADARAELQEGLDRVREELGQLQVEVDAKSELAAENNALQGTVQEAQARLTELEAQLATEQTSRTDARATSHRNRWIVLGAAAPLVVLASLYLRAVGDRNRLTDQLTAARQKEGTLQSELATARQAERTATQQLDQIQRQLSARAAAASDPTRALQPMPATPPVVCPDVRSGRYWTGNNTFAVNQAFSRRCVEESAHNLNQFSSDDVARLFGSYRGAASTVQFVAYVLSINGVAVNPSTCDVKCFINGLAATDRPRPGDVILFINNTLGIYAADSASYEVVPIQAGSLVSKRRLPRAQVKAFLGVKSVTRAATPNQ